MPATNNTYKGKFRPKFPTKYKGDIANIVYRSSWERTFMVFADRNPNILEWSSEEIIIPYIGVDGKPHRYFPDFLIRVKRPENKTAVYLVEIKPFKESQPAVRKQGKSKQKVISEQLVYMTNVRKWDAAKEYCRKRGWEFKVLTEKDIKF